jgi:hypothetical protein
VRLVLRWMLFPILGPPVSRDARSGETRRQRQTADAACPISCELNFESYLMSLTLPALKVTFMSW